MPLKYIKEGQIKKLGKGIDIKINETGLEGLDKVGIASILSCGDKLAKKGKRKMINQEDVLECSKKMF